MKGLSEDDCEDRILEEFDPPARLGPCWEDHSHLLDRFPHVQDTLRRCFLRQNERIKIAELWREMSIRNLLSALGLL